MKIKTEHEYDLALKLTEVLFGNKMGKVQIFDHIFNELVDAIGAYDKEFPNGQ